MNVFNNVSSQVSGLGSSLGSWFKKDGQTEAQTEDLQDTDKTEAPLAPAVAPEATKAPETTKAKKADDDDAASQHSGATEGADSNPPSDHEEEQEGKTGFASGLGFNLSAVQGKASASAKSVGSFFSSAFSKAGASVKEAGSKIKETVEKNTLLSEFNKEQEAFLRARGGGVEGEALPPWVGYPEEEKLKEEILALATDRRNFVRQPPAGVNFEFELESFLPVAQATLAQDPNLENMRFELVPKTIDEETFWRNYFYRVGLIRQSTELSELEREGVDGSTKNSAGETVKEEDWEKELQEELGEYEVVGAESGKDDKWEAEIQDMIDDESDLR